MLGLSTLHLEYFVNALLLPLLSTLGPLAIFLLLAVAFTETGLLAGFVLPGDSFLFAAGVMVAAGVIPLALPLVMGLVAVAAIAGDQVGYLVGRRFGPAVFSRRGARLLSPEHLARSEAFFARHGSKTVVLARFVPMARTVTPVLAGAGRMPRKVFTTYNIIGGVAWTVAMLGGGFLFGGIPFIAGHIELLTVAVVTLSLLPVVVGLWRARRTRAKERRMVTEDVTPVNALGVG